MERSLKPRKRKRGEEKKENESEIEGTQTLSFQSIRGYKTVIINLYNDQRIRGLNRHPEPNGSALQSLFKVERKLQHQKKKNNHADRDKGTIADGYDIPELMRISDAFWQHSMIAKGVSSDCYLRTNLDFLLGHFLLIRGESRRMAELSDLQLLLLENEGLKSASCLLYIMSNGKTNQNNRIEYVGLLRHRDFRLCSMSAMVNYFVWRWEQSGEKFPIFTSNEAWYDTQVLVGMMFLSLISCSILIDRFLAFAQHVTKDLSDCTQRE